MRAVITETEVKKMRIMTINELANKCGYLYNAELDLEIPHAPNNGYNCRHPNQKEKRNGIGCCFQWSCPLVIPADQEDCEKYGYEYEENEFVLIEETEVKVHMKGYKIYLTRSNEVARLIARASGIDENNNVTSISTGCNDDERIPGIYHNAGWFHTIVEFENPERPEYEIVFA